MNTKRRDDIVPEMRERLLSNRSGKLTGGQWLDIVLQPLGAVLVLMLPFGLILIPRLGLLLTRGWLFLLIILGVSALTVAFRAYRYARAPVYFELLRAQVDAPPVWMFWRPLTLHGKDGEVLRFSKRLSPRPLVKADRDYIAYFLRDHEEPVLLSIAPADHPRAEDFQPNKMFYSRLARRSRE